MDWTLASLNVAYLAGFRKPSCRPSTERGGRLLSAELSLLDGHLAGRPWVAGEAFSLADICLAPLARCLKFPIPSPSWHLRQWMARIEQRPAFAAAVAAG